MYNFINRSMYFLFKMKLKEIKNVADQNLISTQTNFLYVKNRFLIVTMDLFLFIQAFIMTVNVKNTC